MTKSYGILPTLSNPTDINALTRLETGSARCCQFVSYGLPPSWYLFSKPLTEYEDDRIGLTSAEGNWRSTLSKLSVTVTPAITTATKGFEVLLNRASNSSLLYEYENSLQIVGSSTVTTGSAPSGVVTPLHLGQLYLDSTGDVWITTGLTVNDWIQVNGGVST